MVKPIGPAPQSTPVKTEVEQTAVQSGEQASRPNKPAPIYSEKAQISRRAEHSMIGEAWALKLQQQLDASKQTAVPTPYPNIANANRKNDSKK
jgi:hypothetical protein